MNCDACDRQMEYTFYINDEYWLRATGGKKEGYLCAHCILQTLGGLDWWIADVEPLRKVRHSAGDV